MPGLWRTRSGYQGFLHRLSVLGLAIVLTVSGVVVAPHEAEAGPNPNEYWFAVYNSHTFWFYNPNGRVFPRSEVISNSWRIQPQPVSKNFLYYAPEVVVKASSIWNYRWSYKSWNGKPRFDYTIGDIFTSNADLHVLKYGTGVISQVCGNRTQYLPPVPPPKISGYKFEDLNGNGIKDPGEPSLSGWTIRLHRGGTQVASTTTNASGYYEFVMDADAGRTPGTYSLSEVLKDGWKQTRSPGSVTVKVGAPGRNYANNNFGNFRHGSIEGIKWADLNGDGQRDTEDYGLPGWTIELVEGGQVIGEAITGADGGYRFDRLNAGTYTVREVLQSGWRQMFPEDLTYTLTIASGTEHTGIDFGNAQEGSIRPIKVHDLNMDGAWDSATEPLLDRWIMRLLGASGDSYEPTETSADLDTSPLWEQLPAGTYTVWEEMQEGFAPTGDSTQTVELAAGQHVTVPFYNVATGRITGVKYHDLDGDGAKQDGEPLIPDWEVTLTYPDGSSATVWTDEGGRYEFRDLLPGEYRVEEESRLFWRQATAASSDVVLGPGHDVQVDFGNRLLGGVVGSKYHDLNGDGEHQPDEPPVECVSIALYTADGVMAGSPVLTDGEGSYTFTDVVPGDYVVRETVPEGWAATSPTSFPVTVSGGATETMPPFLNVKLMTVSGMKYDDSNANGIRDLESVEETGLPGWEIQLHRLQGSTWSLEATTPTGIDGTYEFAEVWPGTYRVEEVLQPGWRQTQAPTADITVRGGDVVEHLDFGNIELGTVTLCKWDDGNSNGIWDADEQAVPGWEFEFRGVAVDGTETSATVVTDAGGSVAVDGLLPGVYSATERSTGLALNPDGTVAEPGWRATTPATQTVELQRGADESLHFGNIQLGWIWGRVTHELYGHGVPGIKIDIEETGETTYTNADGYYFFYRVEPNETTVCPTPDYLVGMDLSDAHWLTRDAVNKSVVVPEGGFGRADFTVYDGGEAWGNAPRTIGYWKNWKNHYTEAEMQAFLDRVNACSAEFNNLTVDDVRQMLHLNRKTSMEEKARAQFLAAWLNIASGKLGFDTAVNVSSVDAWGIVVESADEDGWTTVLDFIRDIEVAFFEGGLTKDVWEVIKDLLDFLNNGLLT